MGGEGLDVSCQLFNKLLVACENSRSSSLLAAGGVWPGGTSANQCLYNKSCGDGVPNANLFNSTFLLVDFGKALCSSAVELQQNSNSSSREEYIPQILNVLL